MNADRRNEAGRRSADRRRDDRRNRDDRRAAAKAAAAEKSSGGSKKKTGKSDSRKASVAKPVINKSKRLFKAFAIVLTILVVTLTIGIMYVFSRLDFFMGLASERVSMRLVTASLDSSSLTDKITKARFTIDIKNDLPFGIILTNLNYNVNLSGYTIAKGVQISPRTVIPTMNRARLPIRFHVDSIMARRGLQKAVKENASGLLQGLLGRLQGKNKKITNDLKGVMKVNGTADFRIKIGGVEIPFTKAVQFEQGS